jgi:hypothetical protein
MRGMNQFMSIAGKEAWNANTGWTLGASISRRHLLITFPLQKKNKLEKLFLSILNT